MSWRDLFHDLDEYNKFLSAIDFKYLERNPKEMIKFILKKMNIKISIEALFICLEDEEFRSLVEATLNSTKEDIDFIKHPKLYGFSKFKERDKFNFSNLRHFELLTHLIEKINKKLDKEQLVFLAHARPYEILVTNKK